MTSEMVKIIKTVIFTLSIFPFFLETLAFATALRYRNHAININKTSNEFFRAIKLRYTNSAKLDISIQNTKCFIEKILLGKDGPLTKVITLDHFCLLITSFNLACMTVFAINGHTDFTYIIAIMSLCFYLFRQACAVEQKSHLITSLVEDYLENTLSHRVNPAREAEGRLRNTVIKRENASGTVAGSAVSAEPEQDNTTKTPSTSKNINTLSKKENSDIIEEVLQEFLA